MKLPKVTSTTELQRNISVLTKSPDDVAHIITKGTKEIGVYLPMSLYKKALGNGSSDLAEPSVSYEVPKGLKKILKKIDTVKYQRDIRKEY